MTAATAVLRVLRAALAVSPVVLRSLRDSLRLRSTERELLRGEDDEGRG